MAQSKYYTKNENGMEKYVFSNEMYDLTMSSNGEVSFDVKQKRGNVEETYGAIINQLVGDLFSSTLLVEQMKKQVSAFSKQFGLDEYADKLDNIHSQRK